MNGDEFEIIRTPVYAGEGVNRRLIAHRVQTTRLEISPTLSLRQLAESLGVDVESELDPSLHSRICENVFRIAVQKFNKEANG